MRYGCICPMQFNKVFDAYCSKKAVSAESIKFLFDGERIRPDQSPVQLEMADGDVIDAVVEQVGGMC